MSIFFISKPISLSYRLPITEKLDYFSAALAIMFALCYTIICIFHLYDPQPSRLTLTTQPTKSSTRQLLALTCTLTYIAHVSTKTVHVPSFTTNSSFYN